MWEYSLNIKEENKPLANFVFNSMSKFVENNRGVVTSHIENGYFKILIAVKNYFVERVKSDVASLIIDIICYNLKEDYLDKFLVLRGLDEMGISAFKKALLNFDKETDRFMVKKALVLEGELYLESFYAFRLRNLQNKWQELVDLSNENREFLLSSESFIDLLKFLVDNLDICEDEISIYKENGEYKIFLNKQNIALSPVDEENIVSLVIDLSPQKINLYFKESSEAIFLLEKLFEERITINKPSFNIQKITGRA